MIHKTNNDFRILIVDDISKNIQVLGNILRNDSYKTGFATNGKQALDLLEKSNFDLILLDIMMPGMDGFEVCAKIRQNNKTKEIPIIFLTAKDDKESVIKGFRVGAQDYVTKPFNADELLSRVSTHIELSDKRKQLANINNVLEEKVKMRTGELEAANMKLEQLDRSKSTFLGLISHEIKTPLNGILGFGDILNSTLTEESNKEYLGYILQSAERLLDFSETALLFAQLSVDKYKFIIKTQKMKLLILEVIEELDSEMKEKNVQVEFDCQESNIIFKCDPILLKIAFKNVIHNAIKFSSKGGKIKFCAYRESNKINITITDFGPGFSEDARINLFSLFTTENIMHHSKGYGLGLPTAKLILEAHGGEIKIDNLKDGGAQVSFVIKEL